MWNPREEQEILLAIRQIHKDQIKLDKKVDQLLANDETIIGLLKQITPKPAVSFTATVTATPKGNDNG